MPTVTYSPLGIPLQIVCRPTKPTKAEIEAGPRVVFCSQADDSTDWFVIRDLRPLAQLQAIDAAMDGDRSPETLRAAIGN